MYSFLYHSYIFVKSGLTFKSFNNGFTGNKRTWKESKYDFIEGCIKSDYYEISESVLVMVFIKHGNSIKQIANMNQYKKSQ